MKILYVKNNSGRAKKFQLKTIIYEENSQKYVKKQAMNAESIPHLKKMKENYKKLADSIINPKIKLAKIIAESEDSLTFEFIEGISLDKKFNDALKNTHSSPKKIINEYVQLISNGFKTTSFDSSTMVTSQFKKLFGDFDYSDLNKKLSFRHISNIDFLFSNMIFRDNSIYIIDYEWIMDVSLPLEYIIYRASCVYKHNTRNYFDQKETDIYIKMEDFFIEKIITGNLSFHVFQKNYIKNIIFSEEEFKNKEQGFQEQDQWIRKQDQLILMQEQEIGEKNQWIQKQKQETKEKNQWIQKQEQEIEEKTQWIQKQEEEIMEYDQVQDEYVKMYTSSSWRLTRFLRKIIRYIK